MANIMLTKRCNLRCPYCFAEEFVGKSSEDITIDNFEKALDFALTNPDEEIGLIGGEPTVHSQFKEILEIIIHDNRVRMCTLFTNGILINKYIKQLSHPKFKLLINCNPPTDMGEKSFQIMKENIKLFVNEFYMQERITLGINMYKVDFEYDYILELLEMCSFQYVRTSVSIPNSNEITKMTSLEYFKIMKPRVLEFFHELLNKGIIPFYDCNAIPKCIFTPIEIKVLEQMIQATGLEDNNLLCDVTACSPVIDILPDLNIIRCFALSEFKAKAADFNNIFEARAYFNNCFDTLAFHVYATEICIECFYKKTMKCSAGCFAFKTNKILEAKQKLLI